MSGHMSAGKLPSKSGCRCTLLAGNSSISLAGSKEQINFSLQSPKMFKMASESFIHALLLFLGLFLHISLWVPLNRYWYPYQAIEKCFYCLARRWLSYAIHFIRGQRGAASITFHSVMSSNGSLSSDYTCYPKHPYRELTLHEIKVAFISAISYFIKGNYSGALSHPKCTQRSLHYYRKWKPIRCKKIGIHVTYYWR